jgi:hypothetical protein
MLVVRVRVVAVASANCYEGVGMTAIQPTEHRGRRVDSGSEGVHDPLRSSAEERPAASTGSLALTKDLDSSARLRQARFAQNNSISGTGLAGAPQARVADLDEVTDA